MQHAWFTFDYQPCSAGSGKDFRPLPGLKLEKAVEIGATRNATSTLQITKNGNLTNLKITGTAEHVTANVFWQNYKVK